MKIKTILALISFVGFVTVASADKHLPAKSMTSDSSATKSEVAPKKSNTNQALSKNSIVDQDKTNWSKIKDLFM